MQTSKTYALTFTKYVFLQNAFKPLILQELLTVVAVTQNVRM